MANTQQISAKAGGSFTWTAADTGRRVYTPTKVVAWDTGTLLGSSLYVQIPTTGYYLILLQLDSFTVAGSCLAAFLHNDTTVLHEVTTTIALGSDANHKAGNETVGLFSANAGDTFKFIGWHTGGGSAVVNFTAARFLL